jgi:hypothetical protein
MTVLSGLKRFGLIAAMSLASGAALAGNGGAAGPERLWLAQEASGNAGAMQMQEELVNQLRRVQVDVPEGYVMTLDQINRLNALFSLNEGMESTRDQAKLILGLQ